MSAALHGKRLVVTGAAHGIGAAVARRCARDGAHVVLVDRDRDVLALADELDGIGSVADVTDADAAGAAIAAMLDRWGGVDGLVNVAGIYRAGDVVQLAPEVWDEVMAVNLRAAFIWSRTAITAMLDAGGGSIVNVASISAERAIPASAAYVASKHALLGLTRSIAIDFGRRGIRANAVSPGSIETDLLGQYLASRSGAREDLIEKNYAGRLGTPDEIAEACAFLLGDAGSFVNGANFVIDGARTVAT